MNQDQVTGRTANRTPTSHAREKTKPPKTNSRSKRQQLHELLRLKYLALGAQAVLLGRLPLWGLAVGGERGAAAVLKMLMAEMETGMAFLGVSNADQLRGRAIGVECPR